MSGDNGQGGNGHDPSNGGMGAVQAVMDGLDSRRKRRETLHFLERAVEGGWLDGTPDADKVWAAVPARLIRIIVAPNMGPREVIFAANVLRLMVKDRIQATGLLDHIDRQDRGGDKLNVHLTKDEQQTDKLLDDPIMAELMTQIEHRRLKLVRDGVLPSTGIHGDDDNGNGHDE